MYVPRKCDGRFRSLDYANRARRARVAVELAAVRGRENFGKYPYGAARFKKQSGKKRLLNGHPVRLFGYFDAGRSTRATFHRRPGEMAGGGNASKAQ